MPRRRAGAIEIEGLSGRCRDLASAMRMHADGLGFLRRRDVAILNRWAGDLEEISHGLVALSVEGDAPGVRRLGRLAAGLAIAVGALAP